MTFDSGKLKLEVRGMRSRDVYYDGAKIGMMFYVENTFTIFWSKALHGVVNLEFAAFLLEAAKADYAKEIRLEEKLKKVTEPLLRSIQNVLAEPESPPPTSPATVK